MSSPQTLTELRDQLRNSGLRSLGPALSHLERARQRLEGHIQTLLDGDISDETFLKQLADVSSVWEEWDEELDKLVEGMKEWMPKLAQHAEVWCPEEKHGAEKGDTTEDATLLQSPTQGSPENSKNLSSAYPDHDTSSIPSYYKPDLAKIRADLPDNYSNTMGKSSISLANALEMFDTFGEMLVGKETSDEHWIERLAQAELVNSTMENAAVEFLGFLREWKADMKELWEDWGDEAGKEEKGGRKEKME